MSPRGGGTVITTDGVVEFPATVIVARDPSGAEVVVDAAEFLDPIPAHYLEALAKDGFGLAEKDGVTVAVKGLNWSFDMARPDVSDGDRRAARDWLARRLESLGLAPDSFAVRYLVVAVDAGNGEEVGRTTVGETDVDL
jgi:hypothetical protein